MAGVIPPSDEEGFRTSDKRAGLKKEGQKADNSEIPVWIWNDRIRKLAPCMTDFKWRNVVEPSLELLKLRAHKRWVKNVTVSFGRWQQAKDRSRERVGSWLKWDLGNQCYQWTGNGQELYIKCLKHRQWKTKVKDYEASRNCVHRAIESNWWEWTSGSRFFHWRWPEEFATLVRDGQPHFQIGEFPTFLERQ